jgi:hypothetical protein
LAAVAEVLRDVVELFLSTKLRFVTPFIRREVPTVQFAMPVPVASGVAASTVMTVEVGATLPETRNTCRCSRASAQPA